MLIAGYSNFDWGKYVDLAEELLSTIPADSDDEAKSRCGISRAYYGAFHYAEKFLRDVAHQTINVHGKGSHNEIIKNFEEFGGNDKKYVFVAEELRLLKRKREQADYNDKYFASGLPSIKLKNELSVSIVRARNIMKKIDELKKYER